MSEKEETMILAQMAATIFAGFVADPSVIDSTDLRTSCVKHAKELLQKVCER